MTPAGPGERTACEALEHECAQTPGSDQRGDDCEAYGLHRGDSQAGKEYRERDGQLDLAEDLPLREPHPRSRFDDRPWHLVKASDRAPYNRQQ
jgi:hypothetical protein